VLLTLCRLFRDAFLALVSPNDLVLVQFLRVGLFLFLISALEGIFLGAYPASLFSPGLSCVFDDFSLRFRLRGFQIILSIAWETGHLHELLSSSLLDCSSFLLESLEYCFRGIVFTSLSGRVFDS